LPFRFLKHRVSNLPLPERQAGTAWEPSKLEKKCISSLNIMFFTTSPTSLSVSHTHTHRKVGYWFSDLLTSSICVHPPYPSMAVEPFVGPWLLFQFLDLLHSR
jgi:hypothetical protein